eukprot:CAMPEP_0114547990 /NCGR_PEP_ID=MMETSP0114-20121206/4745_1 /TAXON_ID=31324 /ORGANISM="Goniomonas sp, Strain m" /LENGTH=354 /DNA_ID=CAMNT_0001732555 /DNA_START=24 /DNA_END=1088 /DNA_ORIENTATION=+
MTGATEERSVHAPVHQPISKFNPPIKRLPSFDKVHLPSFKSNALLQSLRRSLKRVTTEPELAIPLPDRTPTRDEIVVNVRTWTGHSLSCRLTQGSSIDVLKRKIYREFGTPPGMQLLMRRGKVLDESQNCWTDGLPFVSLELRLYPECERSLHIRGPTQTRELLRDCGVYIFDTDQALLNGAVSPEVRRCLERLDHAGHVLGCVSFNRAAVEILQMAGLGHVFAYVVCGHVAGVSKVAMVRHIVHAVAQHKRSAIYVREVVAETETTLECEQTMMHSVTLQHLVEAVSMVPRVNSPVSQDSTGQTTPTDENSEDEDGPRRIHRRRSLDDNPSRPASSPRKSLDCSWSLSRASSA